MTSLLRSLLIIFTVIVGRVAFATDHPTTEARHFQFEAEAKRHCPGDTVVWLNFRTHRYLFKGMRWYGNTKKGAYVCRNEADAEGDRPARNGQ
jgi:hypothetical protein